jgi:hypothetical protein
MEVALGLSEQTHRYVIEVPGMLSEDGWQKKYGGGL